ncbi:DUF3445 domain-containing protein [Aliihoeflea sp. 2WW]|uniref:heme-dependent oxidative N-demethylase family protein n=1 Tax=Aliihoeflea sp. 2WW TaxID=1381123 RepID=UPI000464BD63|nr:DUF3445 domain-containing protein [Aliihoeflea sp. 2WW]
MRHTPFDGSAKPFAIGLRPLDPTLLIEVDEGLDEYLDEKDQLLANKSEAVFVARDDTRNAQREALDLIVGNLTTYHGNTHHFTTGSAKVGGRTVKLEADDDAPLKTAARLVQEDLVLMRHCGDGWRLVAACLCFPSSWSLSEKFDRPLPDIHEPVPQFGRGTRMAQLIARIFDQMQVCQPVERFNWSLQYNPARYHPAMHAKKVEREDGSAGDLTPSEVAQRVFMRIERQTLCKLKESGDILFTIRIYLDPLACLASHPKRAAIAAGFVNQIEALDEPQLYYKGLLADRDLMIRTLRELAVTAPAAREELET